MASGATPEQAVRAWANAQAGLTGEGNPLSRGAYLRSQRSPADGAYAVLGTVPARGRLGGITAEDARVRAHRVAAVIYAGTLEAAETAAAAYAQAVLSLTGNPVPMGSSGVTCLVTDNLSGPVLVPTPPDAGEAYAFAVEADFLLYQQ